MWLLEGDRQVVFLRLVTAGIVLAGFLLLAGSALF